MYYVSYNTKCTYRLHITKKCSGKCLSKFRGRKLSTSKNWAIWLHEYLKDFENKQDVLRYVLCSIGPENKDSDFTWNDFQARNNNELVAIFGNFINRVVVLIHKYWGGKVPSCDEIKSIDKKIIKSIKNVPEIIGNKIYEFKYREAVSELMNLARLGNKYLAEQEPWKLIKKDEKSANNNEYKCSGWICTSNTMRAFYAFYLQKIKSNAEFKRTRMGGCG